MTVENVLCTYWFFTLYVFFIWPMRANYAGDTSLTQNIEEYFYQNFLSSASKFPPWKLVFCWFDVHDWSSTCRCAWCCQQVPQCWNQSYHGDWWSSYHSQSHCQGRWNHLCRWMCFNWRKNLEMQLHLLSYSGLSSRYEMGWSLLET